MTLIQPLDEPLLGTATSTLAGAFLDDPFFRWMQPDEDERSRALVHLNGVPLRLGMRCGHVTQSDGAKAVAIWMPPGRTLSPLDKIRTGMLALPFKIGFRPFGKFMSGLGAMEEIHEKHVPEPHWYLMIVGVDPTLQGQGRGGALVRDGLARADADGTPCYLETSHERNLPFYERLGFRVVESVRLGDDGPEGWAMRRDALRSSSKLG